MYNLVENIQTIDAELETIQQEFNSKRADLKAIIKQHELEAKDKTKILKSQRKEIMRNLISELKQQEDFKYIFWNNTDTIIDEALNKLNAGYKFAELQCEKCGKIHEHKVLTPKELQYWTNKRWFCDDCENHHDKLLEDLDYRKYLKSEHWTLFAFQIKQQRTSCETCGSNEQLQVHHLHYDTLFRELPKDVQVLCKKCHSQLHPK